MARPLIGVTTSITVEGVPERAYVNSAYLRAVEQAGGVPVLLPPQLGREAWLALWPRLHGLVLTGGGDVDPARFGQTPGPVLVDVSPARDALELELVDRALEGDVPLLAICRGIQVLNVALGGTLHQDLPADVGAAVAHSQTAPRHEPTHAVKVMAEGTRLGRVLGAVELRVNSFHHQAIERLGRGLRDVAWAPDGVIEAAELQDGERFVLGVQWHPEDLVGHDPAARRLFAAVVEAAGRKRRGPS
ncbi:MAG TPA: gamma-glutamyl-gamma-aminobutyrate hydrolase family protein [Methylomirabilota bacterium]|nr:gamma-glutamyl-gamma-aminobutyrate hydrolase family protein [Methylomirabilota bacterium]